MGQLDKNSDLRFIWLDLFCGCCVANNCIPNAKDCILSIMNLLTMHTSISQDSIYLNEWRIKWCFPRQLCYFTGWRMENHTWLVVTADNFPYTPTHMLCWTYGTAQNGLQYIKTIVSAGLAALFQAKRYHYQTLWLVLATVREWRMISLWRWKYNWSLLFVVDKGAWHAFEALAQHALDTYQVEA